MKLFNQSRLLNQTIMCYSKISDEIVDSQNCIFNDNYSLKENVASQSLEKWLK